MADNTQNIICPQKGFQERFSRSNVDFVVGGAAMGVGKTWGALLMAAPHIYDPNFRMVYLRRYIADTKAAGAGVDEAIKIYSDIGRMKISENPRLTFDSGAFIDFTHMADQSPETVLERVRGWAYSVIYIDEGTTFTWNTIRLLMSRNRSAAEWSGKIRIACNPKKSSWLRQWVAWWVDDGTGYPIPDRDGVVRYFYIKGENVDSVEWGNTKEEVYEKCKYQIDAILQKMNTKETPHTYEELIKSATYYSGILSDNKALLRNEPGYLGSVAAMGEKQAAANLLGNWNIDPDEDENIPIPRETSKAVFINDECRNGDKWITADLADIGKDNSIFLAWDGLHLFDILILQKSTPKENADELINFANKHNIPDTHIIYDGTRALYINDYIPDAIAFISSRSPFGIFARGVCRLKDECYLRFVYILKNKMMSIDTRVAAKTYQHQQIRQPISIAVEFVEECSVVRFEKDFSGRKKLQSKKQMNQMLKRSMDLVDPCAMRMYPFLQYQVGEELEKTAIQSYNRQIEKTGFNIYDETNWC